jgi:hypothetical protein
MEARLANFRKERRYSEKRAIARAMEISMDVNNLENARFSVREEAVFAMEFAYDVRSNPHVLDFGDGALADKGICGITSDVCRLERAATHSEEWARLQTSALCDDLLSQLPVDIVSSQIRIMLEIEERMLLETS